MSTHTVTQRIAVEWEFPGPSVTRALFDPANPILAQTLDRLNEHRRHRAMIFIDEAVALAHPKLAEQIARLLRRASAGTRQRPAHHPRWRGAQERLQAPSTTSCAPCSRRPWTGSPTLSSSAGGAVMDSVGLAAGPRPSSVLRQVRVPTTVLGQNDAGIRREERRQFPRRQKRHRHLRPALCRPKRLRLPPHPPQRDWLGGVADAFKSPSSATALSSTGSARMPRNFPPAMRRPWNTSCAAARDSPRAQSAQWRPLRIRPRPPASISAIGPRTSWELLSDFRISHGEAVATCVPPRFDLRPRSVWLAPERTGRHHPRPHRGRLFAVF